jgi:hypothetical protein
VLQFWREICCCVRESASADVRASVLWRRLRPRSQAALAEQQQQAHRTAFETRSL